MRSALAPAAKPAWHFDPSRESGGARSVLAAFRDAVRHGLGHLLASVTRTILRPRFLPLVLAALLAPALARPEAGLVVRPALPRTAAAARAAHAGESPAGGTRAEWLHVQSERERHWRGFRDQIGAPGVDWSARAARRSGWKPPPHPARNPHLLGANPHVATASTPPETLRIAILRVDFRTDRGGGASTGDGRFDLGAASPGTPPIDPAPHDRRFYLQHLEALSRYYQAESYGRVVVVGDVWPRGPGQDSLAYSISDMADLGPWEFGQGIYRAAVDMFRTMLFAADTQAKALGDTIPWHDIDRIVVIHAGSDLQSDLRQDSKEDIPTFTLGVADTDRVIFPDSTLYDPPDPNDALAKYHPIDRAAVIPETINQDGYYGAINAVLAHECGHLFFGFLDVYDIESGYPTVGYWSLMDSGNLAGAVIPQPDGDDIFAVGLLPPSVDPFQRFFATDVLDFPEVSYADTMALRDGERHPDMRSVRLTSDEYLLLENRWITPIDTLTLDQDPVTHVILGPRDPDRFEYDSLLPGSGILVWHVDSSVIPFENSLRVNPDFGVNTDFQRLGLSIIEADGLGDLGDPGSPFILGSHRDPYFRSNNAVLSDVTEPNLIPNVRTRPHLRLEFLDEPSDSMRFLAGRAWQLPGFPRKADFPPGGPQLLAIDVDGDPNDPSREICWAGGDTARSDSTALFAVRRNGQGLFGASLAFANLDTRPRPVMAAIATGGGADSGPSWFAVSTFPTGPDLTSPGGRVWMIDETGQPRPGWPADLPALVSTPPVIAGAFPGAMVFVGCADGRVYAIDLDGHVHPASDPPLAAGMRGRLAVAAVTAIELPGGALGSGWAVAAGSASGDVAVFTIDPAAGALAPLNRVPGWPQRLMSGTAFEPDFLWIDFDGLGTAGSNPSGCGASLPELVAHHADRLWAFCATGRSLPGWGRPGGDTLVASLGAGDPDGDGYPEVLTQTFDSRVAFINLSGYPSPGWPRAGSKEGALAENPDLTYPRAPARFPTTSPALALDVDGDRGSEIVALNTSGILAALRADGRTPEGWPLATGSGAGGSPVAADLANDGRLEIVAPDRLGELVAYSLPVGFDALADPWPMLGGDPGRSSALPGTRMGATPAPSRGPLVHGSLKAFPNPARRRPVSFAYQLSEPADVEFRILDPSGHEVASFVRNGHRADNLETWDPGRLPAGLYLAQLRFRGNGHELVEIVPVGLIR